MKKNQFNIIFLLVTILLSMTIVGCSNDNQNSEESKDVEKGQELGEKKVTLSTDTYVSNIGATHVVESLLNEVGYDAEVVETDVGVQFTGLADGSFDASVGLWLPTTHESYWNEYKDDLEKMSMVTEEVELALTVPSYMEDTNSIEDLVDNKNGIGEDLDWQITGISPGAGMMEITENDVMPGYGLDEDWDLQSSSGAVMATELKSAIEDEEPIVVTLWTPHWTFNQFDLKMLDDPKNEYGDPDDIYSMSRKGFKDESPIAYQIIDQFEWSKEQNQEVMYSIQSGMSGPEAAEKFIEENPDMKEKWLEDITIEE